MRGKGGSQLQSGNSGTLLLAMNSSANEWHMQPTESPTQHCRTQARLPVCVSSRRHYDPNFLRNQDKHRNAFI